MDPPIKPPRGIKSVKETSGVLMSVIRTLSASETNEQRDKEKAKLESEYKICDKKLDELILRHEGDLTQVMTIFSLLSQQVSESREKIHKIKENLTACKSLLHCKRDELQKLWIEGLEYKYMLQHLEEIEKMYDVPEKVQSYLSHKQYLHATELLVETVSLGKDSLDGVEGIRELRNDLEQRKEDLHKELLNEIEHQVYFKTCQNILLLFRQGSGIDSFKNSPLRRSIELRMSSKRSASRKLLQESASKYHTKSDNFEVEEDLNIVNQEADQIHFMAILVKCLALLAKVPYAVNVISSNMKNELLHIIQRTAIHINDFNNLQNGNNQPKPAALLELMQTLFEQFKQVAETHMLLLKYFSQACIAHKVDVKLYDMNAYWTQVQYVLNVLLSDYLDIQNMSNEPQSNDCFTDPNDISRYFSRRKYQMKKGLLFKFDGSISALALNSALKENLNVQNKQDKILVCTPDPNNILLIFMPLLSFIEEIEEFMGLQHGVHCMLHNFLSNYMTGTFLRRKSVETRTQIDKAVQDKDAWKATVLLDITTDYKSLLRNTVTVEKCIKEWQSVLEALPIYSEYIVKYTCDALKDYRDTCHAAYRGIVQPYSEDRRICSAAWLKDEDISRFLKSLPNWLNLKAQQEYQARSERKRTIRREHTLEEESPEDIRQRNRREAEMLASNLGEGGVAAHEILSDMSLLKELAQLQESMEWFSNRMLQFASQFRHGPMPSSPTVTGLSAEAAPILPATLQQLTSFAQDFDELANTCLLLLHLEVRVQCFYYLLAEDNFNKERHEPDPKVLELSKVLANVDEAMTTSLHPRKCKYIFEGLGHLIAKILISSSQNMKVIDEAGIQRMCRNVFALQQTLTNITMTREVALDHARHYFELFFLAPEEILNGIVEKGPEFSELEYMNAFQLLYRSKAGKDESAINIHLERLTDILGEVGVTV